MRTWKIFFIAAIIVMLPRLSLAKNLFSFEGQADFSKSEFNITFNLDDKSSVAAKAQKMSENDYRIMLDIEHLKTPLFDLLSKIESSIQVVKKEGASLLSLKDVIFYGKIQSQYSLIDYKPVKELSGNFEIKDKRLHLTALSAGNVTCSGYIDLIAPYELDMAFDLQDVPMNDFLNFWGTKNKYESSGAVFGEIKASGNLENLVLKGSLESRQGFVQSLNYDTIVLNIEGVYPHMVVSHSTVSKADGVSFMMDGPINLKDKANFKKQIKALTLAPLISDSGSEMEWTIKRLNPEDSDTTELKYRFRKGDALGIGTSADDESDMFGIEQTRKF